MSVMTPVARKIRSFVRRQGRLTAGQERALQEGLPELGLYWESSLLDFPSVFGRTAPVNIEIGFGMGDALTNMAEASPDEDFIGIEVHQPGVGKCLMQVQEKSLQNVRICVGDAVEIVSKSIPDSSVARFNIYFPDPWHKKRHHKRRLIQASFVKMLVQKLQPNGILHLATDWQEYAEQMLQVCSDELELINQAHDFSPRPESRPLTKFEARGHRLGHGIWDLIFRKKTNLL